MAAQHNRPLSPHLQVYKLPITGLISITHRMTGVLLSGGLLFVVYLLFSLANGQDSFNALQTVIASFLPRLLFWGFILALYIHLCHGIRHLIWDMGDSFNKHTLTRYAVIELIASSALTLLTFIWMGPLQP